VVSSGDFFILLHKLNIETMKNIMIISIIAAMFAIQCKTSKNVSMTQEQREVINTNSFVGEEKEADFKVHSATLEGHILNIVVVFTGEKGKHEFDLVWNGSIMKSLPPKVILVPVHKSSGAGGKKEVIMKMSFDLSVVKERFSGNTEFVIMIKDYEHTLKYSAN
jgi:hypothetical protein